MCDISCSSNFQCKTCSLVSLYLDNLKKRKNVYLVLGTKDVVILRY